MRNVMPKNCTGKRVALTVILSATISACSQNKPDDLTLDVVQKKEFKTEKEFNTAFWRQIATSGTQEILRVQYSSNIDLGELSLSNDYNILSNSYFCNKKEQGLIGVSSVFYKGKNISYERKKLENNSDEPFNYYSYIFVKGLIINDANRNNRNGPTYNLRENVEDVCVSVRSATYFKESNSNIIVIPKERIQEALAGGGKR